MHLYGSQGDLTNSSVMGALRLLDIPNSVEKVVASESRRTFYKVKDLGSGVIRTCRPTQRYCTCDQFIQVVMSDAITCQHVLATKLSEALGLTQETKITDVAFAEYMCS
ncbi:hypothetical protein BCR41DRAFT_359285 [Lobosporangium transversale]|uniref:SWIM-type domain-containing protein n=1 Tax=Lobosporangium transversale TaxID=64571 RepID=A0A1Y2GIF6_9FUNG|nr:hypothetical protein BCR41DRAFT_359285 [Lobosporangium transversale]ORZ08482.1 hypothetical protein BCR41DRAFT_359285 [Lobosporangium transversale]|eukprot:XP_021878410.1 hypothetical protein BCR41DRAFT_359285 [Lobosporangium transversale]